MRIGKMACEIALQRPRKVRTENEEKIGDLAHVMRFTQHITIIHKSNVLSVTDGLFRETVRRVPSLPEVNGRYDSIQIGEQIVDSAVYRYVDIITSPAFRFCRPGRSPASPMFASSSLPAPCFHLRVC